MSGSAVCVLTFGRGYMAVSGIKTSSRTGAFCSRNIMDSGRALCAVLAALLLISSGSAGTIQTGELCFLLKRAVDAGTHMRPTNGT